MLHLVIDSSIYRQDPSRRKAAFRAVARLGAAGEVQLYIPYFVEREFLSQEIEECQKQVEAAESAVRRLSAKNLAASMKERLQQQGEALGEMSGDLDHVVRQEFDNWVASTKAERLQVSDKDALRVAQAYFEGAAPFKTRKARNDFPDAFIYMAIADLKERVGKVHVVVHDGNLRTCLSALEAIQCHDMLEGFIATSEVVGLISVIEPNNIRRNNLTLLQQAVEASTGILRVRLYQALREALVGEVVYCDEVLTEENEADLHSVGTINEVLLDAHRMEYYGGGDLVIPFSAQFDGSVSYELEKDDFNDLELERFNHINVDWETEDTVQITEDYPIMCSGTLMLSVGTAFPEKKMAPVDARSLVERADITVDSLINIYAAT